MSEPAMPLVAGDGRSDDISALIERYGALDGEALLAPMIKEVFPSRIALVSSFGAEAAVLLALVAAVDRNVPVIFLDTGKIFGETLRYRDTLIRRIGLQDVRTVQPNEARINAADSTGTLWHRAPDTCCYLRKVEPLKRALTPFAAWISGRKRYQGGERAQLPAIEAAERRIKINPLATWSRERIEHEFRARALPRHPLEADGFLSIGCMPCTARVAPGAAPRSGRWQGRGKTECGIHLAEPKQAP